jgi:hypothetical protein
MTLLGKILAVLNVLAAAAFAYLAVIDYSKRQEAAAAAYHYQLAAEGTPVDVPKDLNPGLPRDRYLAKAPPSLDPPSALKDDFQGTGPGEPINVQVKELDRVQRTFFDALVEAARQAGLYKELVGLKPAQLQVLLGQAYRGELRNIEKNNLAAKQLEDVLLLAPTGELRAKLIHQIGTAKKLEDLLQRVAVRRMLAQALLPLEERRQGGHREELALILGDLGDPAKQPAVLGEYLNQLDGSLKEVNKKVLKDPKDWKNSKIPEFEEVKLDLSLTGRIAVLKQQKSDRDDVSQRQDIAYFLLTLSQVVKPDGALLDNPSDRRVEVIVGRQRFADALEMQTATFRHTVERMLDQIRHDLATFVAQYNREVKDRFPSLRSTIQRYEEVLKDWEDQEKAHKDQRDKRIKDYENAVAILAKEREKATQILKELGEWQQRLFRAQLAGSGVLEENLRLEKQIVELEKGR